MPFLGDSGRGDLRSSLWAGRETRPQPRETCGRRRGRVGRRAHNWEGRPDAMHAGRRCCPLRTRFPAAAPHALPAARRGTPPCPHLCATTRSGDPPTTGGSVPAPRGMSPPAGEGRVPANGANYANETPCTLLGLRRRGRRPRIPLLSGFGGTGVSPCQSQGPRRHARGPPARDGNQGQQDVRRGLRHAQAINLGRCAGAGAFQVTGSPRASTCTETFSVWRPPPV